ncbi:MAG: hypothetical protein K8R69_10995 [Deltaproteobacteria bacterium]|nr:hypothetical protein [Deltaproteobacteria bacterium]
MNEKGRRSVRNRNGHDKHDTYWNQAQPKDHSFCGKCSAIYHNKHWFFDEKKLETLRAEAANHQVLCPACHKIQDHFASGRVLMSGEFLREHREEILNLVKNAEKRAMGMNPLERIIEIANNGKGIEITTTHEKLAQRIGKSLYRAFSGTVDYQWARGDKMARVSWCRD